MILELPRVMTQGLSSDSSIKTLETIKSSPVGLVIAHGGRTRFNQGIIRSLAKKLAEKNISSIRFPFHFALEQTKPDNSKMDELFVEVYREATRKHPNIEWMLCGHGIGAVSAVRIAPIASEWGDLPHIIGLNYPLYPPNKPERVNMSPLAAIIGEALFCQGTASNRGDYKRMSNSLRMMAEHVHVKPINGANYQMEVNGKPDDRVAFWISNDIERFIKELGLV